MLAVSIIIVAFSVVFIYNLLKGFDRPADPKDEADFWSVCFFSEFWRGPHDKG